MNNNKINYLEFRAIWSLGIVFSLRILGIFIVLPILMTYGMVLQEASEFLIGLAIGIYGLMQAIFQIPFGLISDRIGRKPLIIIGLLIFAIGSIMAALSNNIWGLIFGRALQGSGAISSTIMALLSDLTREQNRTKAMALIGIGFGVTFTIAIIIGPIVVNTIGLSGLFYSIAGLTLISILIVLLIVPTPRNYIFHRELNIVRSSIGQILTNSQLLKLNISVFCLHTILMFNFIVLPPMIVRIGISSSEQWKIYLITMIVSFSMMIPTIVYSEATRCIKRVFCSCVMLLLSSELLLFVSHNHLWIVFAGIQLFFLGFNIIEAFLPSLISKESPAGYKGTAMGVYSTSQFLGVAFGGIFGGFLFQLNGELLVFLTGIIISFFWLCLSKTLREPQYLSNLRISLPDGTTSNIKLMEHLKAQPGVTEVLIVPEERSIYIKVDIKKTSFKKLERMITIISD